MTITLIITCIASGVIAAISTSVLAANALVITMNIISKDNATSILRSTDTKAQILFFLSFMPITIFMVTKCVLETYSGEEFGATLPLSGLGSLAWIIFAAAYQNHYFLKNEHKMKYGSK